MQIILSTLFAVQTLATDIGLIGFFETSCPEGWISWNNAPGRVIVMEGTNQFDGRYESFKAGNIGGESRHQQTRDQVGQHQHQQSGFSITNIGYGGGIYQSHGGLSGSEHAIYKSVRTNSTGQSQPFNVRDPYYVLKACKKLNASTSSDAQRIQDIQTQLTQKTQKIVQLETNLADKQAEINELKKNDTTFQSVDTYLNAEIEAVQSRVVGLENQQDYDNGAELGLSIGAITLSALALIIECLRICANKYKQ